MNHVIYEKYFPKFTNSTLTHSKNLTVFTLHP